MTSLLHRVAGSTAAAALALTGAVALAGPAAATGIRAPQVAVSWTPGACSDLGASVRVTVTDGVPGTEYTAAPKRGYELGIIRFRLDAQGHGTGAVSGVINDDYAGEGDFTGPATIIVKGGGGTTTAVVEIDCYGSQGG
jgi:hypothetical protein